MQLTPNLSNLLNFPLPHSSSPASSSFFKLRFASFRSLNSSIQLYTFPFPLYYPPQHLQTLCLNYSSSTILPLSSIRVLHLPSFLTSLLPRSLRPLIHMAQLTRIGCRAGSEGRREAEIKKGKLGRFMKGASAYIPNPLMEASPLVQRHRMG